MAGHYLQTGATTQVKVGAGKLRGILCSSSTSGALKIYDTPDADTNDPVILETFSIAAGSSYFNVIDGVWFSKGLYIVLTGTAEFTVIYE